MPATGNAARKASIIVCGFATPEARTSFSKVSPCCTEPRRFNVTGLALHMCFDGERLRSMATVAESFRPGR